MPHPTTITSIHVDIITMMGAAAKKTLIFLVLQSSIHADSRAVRCGQPPFFWHFGESFGTASIDPNIFVNIPNTRFVVIELGLQYVIQMSEPHPVLQRPLQTWFKFKRFLAKEIEQMFWEIIFEPAVFKFSSPKLAVPWSEKIQRTFKFYH